MNMENFINGFPGVEHRLRAKAAAAMGAERAERFFDLLATHFLAEADIEFAAALGANVLRIPVNYRHFESDDAPYVYREAGFNRLAAALDLCARHGLYAVVDLHAAPGWQNPDWHCDNMSRSALLWDHPHFVDRTERLWGELAGRLAGHPAVCGYDLLNEPATGGADRPGAGSALSSLYRRLIRTVRQSDPTSLIFVEGDMFGSRFDDLELPDTDGVVCSFHDYGRAQMRRGPYPGIYGPRWLDADAIAETVHSLSGPRFAARHGLPVLVGEFGVAFPGPPADDDDRLRALDDQITVFEQAAWSWIAWTLKDMGAMGVLSVDPESPYGRLAAVTGSARAACRADRWASWERRGPVSSALSSLADGLSAAGAGPYQSLRDEIEARVCSDFAADRLQDGFVHALAAIDDEGLEAAAASFSFGACQVRKPYADLLAERMARRG